MTKYFQIFVSQLVDTFSRIESGKIFDFIIDTSEPSLNASTISKDDVLIVTVNDDIYYKFDVIDKTGNEIQLKKSFEIQKSIKNNLDTIGQFKEIDNKTYEQICSLLFSNYIHDITKPSLNNELGNLKEMFANWLISKNNKYGRVYNYDKETLIKKLSEFENLYNEDFNLLIFNYPSISIDTIIEALEINIIDESTQIGDLNKRTVGNGSIKAILGPNNYIKFLKEIQLKVKTSSLNSPKVDAINKIYFGAPGSGKSYQITEDLKAVDEIFQKRVTFHPEFDNASFVGGYKPKTDFNGSVKYEFVPQIFTNIFVEACNDPDHQYYLIIEEINRGNCAEIFGELFQLLDRNEKYKITPSKELIDYLFENIPNSKYFQNSQMLLPDNLSILATMNTSDQSLYPMDSAFKRRWEWEYIPINYNKVSTNKSSEFIIKIDDETKINWIDFIQKVNKNKIEKNLNLGMDKCIGNYFIKPDSEKEIGIEKFIYKVVFYLWNDVFKDEPRESIFKDKITYQSFFPIKDDGVNLVKSIMKDLGLLGQEDKTEDIKEA
jgi:hypothetical protein